MANAITGDDTRLWVITSRHNATTSQSANAWTSSCSQGGLWLAGYLWHHVKPQRWLPNTNRLTATHQTEGLEVKNPCQSCNHVNNVGNVCNYIPPVYFSASTCHALSCSTYDTAKSRDPDCPRLVIQTAFHFITNGHTNPKDFSPHINQDNFTVTWSLLKKPFHTRTLSSSSHVMTLEKGISALNIFRQCISWTSR